ncbi:hypothetical protein N9W28_01260 [Alphaproteobacteria bacterium]|nr:hypothetical protein [Alphaproteobacteria bacterium]
MFTNWNITSLENGKAQDLVASYDDERRELTIIDNENNTQIVIFVDNPENIKNQINYIFDTIIKISGKVTNPKKVKSNFMEKIREKFPNAYKKWENADDLELKKMFQENISMKEMASFFKRKNSAIRQRLIKLGLIGE